MCAKGACEGRFLFDQELGDIPIGMAGRLKDRAQPARMGGETLGQVKNRVVHATVYAKGGEQSDLASIRGT